MENAKNKPLILAPAGNRVSFLAAIAAGADAIYCGLKNMSARMEADNFSTAELAQLTKLAHSKGIQVYVTLNTMLKTDELEKAGRLIKKLTVFVKPDALIFQDPAIIDLSKKAGFKGELHLSTLANFNSKGSLELLKKSGVNRIVLPRELNVDEVKMIAEACPEGLSLEVFVHGALCYAVSGRCYWSSFLGGRSGLRGRCVQPCRRIYDQNGKASRFFSCLDLSVDVLAKVLLDIPQVSTWKIEGRKKGPHYVYYTVTGYRMLRDGIHDPKEKKVAVSILESALGRENTHYNFLPQRPQIPVKADLQTASGRFMGKVQGPFGKWFFSPREDLYPGDLLRVGYEDQSGHMILKVSKSIPKRGKLSLQVKGKKNRLNGFSVFLIDRREKELTQKIAGLEGELEKIGTIKVTSQDFTFFTRQVKGPKKKSDLFRHTDMVVKRIPDRNKSIGVSGVWISERNINDVPGKFTSGYWWWLPPVIWPLEEEKNEALIHRLIKKGARNFVINSPWQVSLFDHQKNKGIHIIAGPYCNISNPLFLSYLAGKGVAGAVVSPELSSEDYLDLPSKSPIPLGIVLYGNWPVAISRTKFDLLKSNTAFKSPMKEEFWIKKAGENYWVFPNWYLDLRNKRKELQKAGYSFFVTHSEPIPKSISMKKRKGLWNWDLQLL